jgi:transcriptional regulator of arginine metabolism
MVPKMNLTRKLARQREVLNTIRSQPVRTQVDLAGLLRERGFAVSQPTLSKDIAELGLVKVPLPDGGYRYQPSHDNGPDPQGRRLQVSMREFLLEAEAAGQIVVLKTVAGHAAGLAWSIDNAAWPEAVGTIAGEDTVMIVARNHSDATAIMKHLERVIET